MNEPYNEVLLCLGNRYQSFANMLFEKWIIDKKNNNLLSLALEQLSLAKDIYFGKDTWGGNIIMILLQEFQLFLEIRSFDQAKECLKNAENLFAQFEQGNIPLLFPMPILHQKILVCKGLLAVVKKNYQNAIDFFSRSIVSPFHEINKVP